MYLYIIQKQQTNEIMENQEITFEVLGSKFKAVKEFYNTKIDVNGGAAPWMIGRTVKTSKTHIYDYRGKYLMTFGFSFKNFNKSESYRKMTLNQLEKMILN